MSNYVVRDGQGKFQIIGADGFIPAGALGPAPADADFGDGELLDEVSPGVFQINVARKATRDAALAAAKAAQDAIATDVATKAQQLKTLLAKPVGTNYTAAEIQTILRAVIRLLVRD